MITKEKFILKSKTVQGLIVMALPMLASLIGFEWTGEDNGAVNQTIDAMLTFIGLAWGLIGRFTAATNISILGGSRMLIGPMLVASMGMGAVGCATTGEGGLTRAQAADLVITQLEATLDSAEAVAAILDDEGVPPEELQIARVILAAAKPQIISWINLVETLQMNADQAAQAAELKARADALIPPAEA
jgi:hypothetical protein